MRKPRLRETPLSKVARPVQGRAPKLLRPSLCPEPPSPLRMQPSQTAPQPGPFPLGSAIRPGPPLHLCQGWSDSLLLPPPCCCFQVPPPTWSLSGGRWGAAAQRLSGQGRPQGPAGWASLPPRQSLSGPLSPPSAGWCTTPGKQAGEAVKVPPRTMSSPHHSRHTTQPARHERHTPPSTQTPGGPLRALALPSLPCQYGRRHPCSVGDYLGLQMIVWAKCLDFLHPEQAAPSVSLPSFPHVPARVCVCVHVCQYVCAHAGIRVCTRMCVHTTVCTHTGSPAPGSRGG